MYTVIFRDQGIDRHYPCNNFYDAEILFDALAKLTMPRRIEMWKGKDILKTYDIRFEGNTPPFYKIRGFDEE